MSKGTAAANAIKWLAGHADDAVASAADLRNFGPRAAQVRALLSFLPTMSDEAVRASGVAGKATWGTPGAEVFNADWEAASNAASRALPSVDTWNDVSQAASDAARGPAWNDARNLSWDAWDAATNGAGGAAAGDFITPENYRILTNPLAAGRAVDLLRARPRNQGTQFLDVVRSMGERGALTGPRDVVVASRLANKYDDDIIETALALMSDGMSAEEAMRTARLL